VDGQGRLYLGGFTVDEAGNDWWSVDVSLPPAAGSTAMAWNEVDRRPGAGLVLLDLVVTGTDVWAIGKRGLAHTIQSSDVGMVVRSVAGRDFVLP
jgi:hypothetical protein